MGAPLPGMKATSNSSRTAPSKVIQWRTAQLWVSTMKAPLCDQLSLKVRLA
jgi:hypothetical protein